MKFRILSFVLSVLLLIPALSAVTCAYAAEPETGEYIITLSDEGRRDYLRDYLLKEYGGCLLAEYHTLLRGFAITLPKAEAWKIPGLAGVESLLVSLTRARAAVTAYPLCDGSGDGSDISAASITNTLSEPDTGVSESEKPGKASRSVISPRAALGEEYDGLRGEGMIIAVVDSSFDVTHPLFTLSADTGIALTRPEVDELQKAKLSIANSIVTRKQDAYVSAKIPFAYDYVGRDTDTFTTDSHGTHVAGILAANAKGAENGFDGIAPEAQLLLMKCQGDTGTDGFKDYAIVAACEDALLLGADVINISAGAPASFEDYSGETVDYNALTKKIHEAGIAVVCAAGNEGSLGIGVGTGYEEKYGVSGPPAAHPDTGVISCPSAGEYALAAASYNGELSAYDDGLLLTDGIPAPCWDGSISSFGSEFAGRTLSYAEVSGVGLPEDFEGLNLSGRIALINRGDITFIEKLKNAEKAGAIGAVIINAKGSDPVTMLLEEGLIPAVMVSWESGRRMISLISGGVGRFTVVSDSFSTFMNPDGGTISDFSSWGPTPALRLKPDVTAPGGLIYSAAAGGGYTIMSGTSMSSPYTAGTYLLLLEKHRNNHGDRIENDRAGFINALLMSSAQPLKNSEGIEYSPRRQGAGVLSLGSALDCGTLITSSDGGFCRVNLGGGISRSADITFNLENLSDTKKTYSLSAVICSDSAEFNSQAGGYFITGEPTALKSAAAALIGDIKILSGEAVINSRGGLNRFGAKYSPASVTLEGKSGASLTIRINLSVEESANLLKAFKNGFYLEGYIYAECADESVSLPYCGFVGDWSALPSISEDPDYFPGALVSMIVKPQTFDGYLLGENIFDEDLTQIYRPELAAISPDGNSVGDYLGVRLCLLRNVTTLKFTVHEVRNGQRVPVYIRDEERLAKAYVTGESEPNKVIFYSLWNGGAADCLDYRFADGEYVLEVRAFSEAGGAQSVFYSFRIDTVKPVLHSHKIETEGGRRLLTLNFSDNVGVQALRVYEGTPKDAPKDFEPFDSLIAVTPDEDTATFDITDADDGHLYIEIADYAGNTALLRISIDG